jgi:repressor LexA
VDSLTPRQAKVLRLIITWQQRHGWAPTILEICKHFEWASTNAAFGALAALEKKGAIERKKSSARAIRVTATGLRALA